MTCNTCRSTVQENATGICLGCQGGFNKAIDSDHLEKHKLTKLLSRKQELEDALQEPSTKKDDVCDKTKTGKRVRKQNSKRKETSEKGKKG
jgi:hypothetical protein